MADWRIFNNIRCAVNAMLMAVIVDKLLEFLDKVIKITLVKLIIYEKYFN